MIETARFGECVRNKSCSVKSINQDKGAGQKPALFLFLQLFFLPVTQTDYFSRN